MSKSVGRYEIGEELGRGGMAAVYLAYDPQLGREVALKLMDQQLSGDPTFATRFEREAKTVAALEHGTIVSLYDYGEADGWLYLVMRYMKGGSLKEQIAEGPLSLERSYGVVRRIGRALDKAHRMNIIHRDLKPGNILLDEDGEAYLSDFGIVKVAKGEAEYLTETGQTLGTFAYMSPEQVLGKELDGRSDIYALGIVLYEMLTRVHPFGKVATTSGAMAVAHTQQPIPDVTEDNPDLPPSLIPVIRKALAKDPADRYKAGAEMAAAIRDALTSTETTKATAAAAVAKIDEQPAPRQPEGEQPAAQPPVRQPAAQEAAAPATEEKRKLPIWAFALVGVIVIAIIAAIVIRAGDSTMKDSPKAPASSTVDPEVVEALYNDALKELNENGDPAAALALIEQAIKEDPNIARYYSLRAHARAIGLGEYAEAVADMDRAIELEPMEAFFYAARGNFHASNGDLDAALADFDQAAELQPDNPYHLTGLANIYVQMGDVENAREAYERAIDVAPLDHSPYIEFASQMVAGELGDVDDAIKVLSQCELVVRSGAHWCVFDRGWRHHEAGLTEEAVQDFETFLEIVPAGDCPGCQDEARAYIQEFGQ